jgi:hypothetical protein
MRNRLLTACLLWLGTVSCLFARNAFKDNYELALRSQAFVEALVRGDSRAMYEMFAPAFRAENSFARFDSAVGGWIAGRRVVKARRKVVDVKGVSGYISTWVVFAGERKYRYLYQNWLKDGKTWDIVWISRILDQSFQYGRQDTVQMRQAAEAGVRYVLSRQGRANFRERPARPDTVVMIRRDLPEEHGFQLDGLPVVWVTPEELAACAPMPRVPFYVGLAMVRVFGDMAEVAVDVFPSADSAVARRRGVKIYLEQHKGVWQFHSIGKVW